MHLKMVRKLKKLPMVDRTKDDDSLEYGFLMVSKNILN